MIRADIDPTRRYDLRQQIGYDPILKRPGAKGETT